MAHSYGGVPSTQCTKGVTKMERQRQGKKGGLIRIAYMTCLVPPVGGSAGSVLTEIPDENRIDFTVDVSDSPPPSAGYPTYHSNKTAGGGLAPLGRSAGGCRTCDLRSPRSRRKNGASRLSACSRFLKAAKIRFSKSMAQPTRASLRSGASAFAARPTG